MKVNCDLQSEIVFEKFCEISSIPHCSYDTKAISDFCVNEAKRCGFKYIQDKYNNVVVYVDGTAGYETEKPVIIQGHIDMVGVKNEDCELDLETDPIKLCTDGEYIYADKTSLGGDDGVAVAYMLALMQDKTIPHPPLELVFTSDEEVGLIGVRYLKSEMFHTNRVINIDSEEEGVLTVGCAGGVRANCKIPVTLTDAEGECFELCVSGLIGGHSGIEIHKGRLNANKLIARILNYLILKTNFKIVSISGGSKDNVIANDAKVKLCVTDEKTFMEAFREIKWIITTQTLSTEPYLKIDVEKVEPCERCMDENSTRKVIFVVTNVPNGVISMNPDIEGMVQTSLNLGVISTFCDCVLFEILIRSNITAGRQEIGLQLKTFFEYLGGESEYAHEYPAWEYKENSKIRDIMVNTYRDVFKSEPVVSTIHAGLECGILSGIIEDMDAISFGPNILNVHTPQEKMEIASVCRNWEYLKTVLKNLK